jgi:hypothetical protein
VLAPESLGNIIGVEHKEKDYTNDGEKNLNE